MGLRPDLAPHENRQPQTYFRLVFASKRVCKRLANFLFSQQRIKARAMINRTTKLYQTRRDWLMRRVAQRFSGWVSSCQPDPSRTFPARCMIGPVSIPRGPFCRL